MADLQLHTYTTLTETRTVQVRGFKAKQFVLEWKVKHAQNNMNCKFVVYRAPQSNPYHILTDDSATGRHESAPPSSPSCRQMTPMSKKHEQNDQEVSAKGDYVYWDITSKGFVTLELLCKGWKDGSVVGSMGCSPGRPGFGSWLPHSSSQLSVAPAPGGLIPSYRYACRKGTTVLKIKIKS